MISMSGGLGRGSLPESETQSRNCRSQNEESAHVVDIFLEYQGDLQCRAVHGPSSAVLVTDAPVDNQGRGESFSPTDLVATGLGACMATVMGILARKHGYA